MEDVLSVHQLTKVFLGAKKKKTVAVDKITFSVRRGEIVGLLGPNGAGKTTTIQMLLGTTAKTSGTIRYFGLDLETNREAVLKRVNYASAYTRFPWHMTVYENLMVYARLYGVINPRNRIEKLLKQFDIFSKLDRPMNSLSAGQTTRVILAKAFINYPQLLLLDEPTASLDPESADKVREFILKQQKEYGVAMVFTSHNMAEVSEVCERVLFVQKGKIVAEDTPAGLAAKIDETTINLQLTDGKEQVIRCKETEVSQELQRLASKGIKYRQISIEKPTLEDYFIHETRKKI